MGDDLMKETGAGGPEIEQGSLQQKQQEEDVSSSIATTMKFAFTASKPKFSASRPPQFPRGGGKRRSEEGRGWAGGDNNVVFVTGFDEQGLVGKDSIGLGGARVIPKLENSWRPEKRMKNIMMETDIMTSSQEDRFEKETVVGGPNPGVQYGLVAGVKKVVETSRIVATELNGTDMVQERKAATGLGSTEQKTNTPLTFAELENERLRQDLVTLPDVADLDAYNEMPVEGFGAALLRGMGWEKGKPIGRDSKVAVVPVEYVRRSGRTGLGAEPAPKEVNNSRQIRPGESRLPAPELVASIGSDGRARNVVAIDEKLVERTRKGVIKGKVMSIIYGRHLGLRGEILDADKSDRIVMKLAKSGEKVLVSAADLADIGSLEEEKVLKQIRQLKIGNGEASLSDDRRGDLHLRADDRKEESRYGRKEDKRDPRRDTRRDERDDYTSRTEYRREVDERSSRSRRDGRRDEKDIRRDRKREDYKRTDDDMDIEDEGRIRRSENRRSSARDQVKEERRDDGRRGENKRDGRREDNIRTHQDRGERVGDRERGGIYNDKEYQKERGESGSARRDAIGPSTEARYKDSWLTSQIRVRIISKTLKGGRFYLKKGRIVDVVTPHECDILLDESGEILQQVKQEQLETALPKRGGRIIVVGGKYRGQLGKLIERDSEGEVGLLQLEENFEMTTLDLDLLAEFVGEASERDD